MTKLCQSIKINIMIFVPILVGGMEIFTMAKGNISVNSENLFPIIKKWLYSDKDIFLRELVSNACDAVTKLKKLTSLGEASVDEDTKYRIDVVLSEADKTITISDNGIGMTAEEVDKYITQIAFSGASDFLAKYKDEKDEKAQIIGHFGLGFYSAFMAADVVTIDTLSYIADAKPARWECDGTMEYDLSDGTREDRGTTITLHISDENKEFLNEFNVRSILKKYCSFLPVEVYFNTVKDGDKTEPELVCDTNPLWMKKPSECSEDEYKKFYSEVFMDMNEPLFWIHLNVDYPFNLKGILYFPKINHEFSGREGQIKLFNNQVYVADNVSEVIPEFLMLLKGVIDCPDLPLNVSRSFLQNDGYVKKISSHITKKVADKLTSLYKNNREEYNKYWDDIAIFIKYGCLSDDKFYDKVKDAVLYKTTDGDYTTITDLADKSKDIYYTNDALMQSQYINMFKEQNITVIEAPTLIDTQYISFIEMKNSEIKFKRVDSNVADLADNSSDEVSFEAVIEKFKSNVSDIPEIEAKALLQAEIPAVLILKEESRRMKEMYAMYTHQMPQMANMFREEYTLVLNTKNELVSKLTDADDATAKIICEHIYDLASLSNKPLEGERMTKFIERSNKLMSNMLN